MMGDGKQAFAARVIDVKSPNEPNEGMGYRICPDGKYDHAYKATIKDMCELCGKISSSLLTEKAAGQILYQRLIPKLE